MKLYATVTSERATKNQGGNQYIRTDYYVGSRDKSVWVATATLTTEPDGYRLKFRTEDFEKEVAIKGEKQKGEMTKGWTNADYEAFDAANNS